MGFQHTEQLRLHFERHLGHFIQKQSPFVGQAKVSRIVTHRAGERATDMAKQLAFQQARGQRSAAYRVKRTTLPGRKLMQRRSQQLLSGSGFPSQQHTRLALRGFFDDPKHPKQTRIARHHTKERSRRSG